MGPLVGTAILTALPELARPLAENRPLVYGVLLMAVIALLPRGIWDTAAASLRRRRIARDDGPAPAPPPRATRPDTPPEGGAA
jgi:branched-chain amino acid transport system permease protein